MMNESFHKQEEAIEDDTQSTQKVLIRTTA